MTQAFGITTDLVASLDEYWIATEKVEAMDLDGNVVTTSRLLTGEMALANKAVLIIDRYEAHLEASKQRLIAIARNMLTGAEVG